jgi:hypothetical protein
VISFPQFSYLSYYGAEQETDASEMIFFLVYCKKKRGFRSGKDSQKFAFELIADTTTESIAVYCRRLLIELDTAVLKFQQRTGTTGGKKKWSNVLSPRLPRKKDPATEGVDGEAEQTDQPPAEGAVDDEVYVVR